MTYVKHHWFGLILSTVVLIYFIVFILVLAAPKQDKPQRGFAACSAKMLEQVQQKKSPHKPTSSRPNTEESL